MPEGNQHPPSQRKDATVLFADLSGFTAMSSALDPEEVRDVVNRYFEALAAAVRRYEGTIDKYIGDCVMAVFGVPVAHADDAARACRAALDMQSAVRELAAGFTAGTAAPEIHIGINTGLVVAAPMGAGETAQFTVMGDAVNMASRLCHEADNGQTAVGESTWLLANRQLEFAPQELRSIKGKTDKIPVYFLTGFTQDNKRPSGHDRLPIVGRAREIAVVHDLLAGVSNGAGAICHVVGEPGIGKSRFAEEISEWAAEQGFRVVSASASPLAAIDPCSLWRQLLEQMAGVSPGVGDAARETALTVFLQSTAIPDIHTPALRASLGLPVAEFELLDESLRFDRIAQALTALLRALRNGQPLLVVLDDLQWADSFSLQLLNRIIDPASGPAAAWCCLARPEFRPEWADLPCYRRITLQPLSAEDSSILISRLLKESAPTLGTKIVSTADGNPFYLTELAQAMAHRTNADKLPGTITGLIQERIDRLEPRARQILEAASVIGREFPERLLRALGDSHDFESQLRSLHELELIYQKEILPELLHLFRHHLTQETTYNSILMQRRKEMHRQVAQAIEKEFQNDLDRHYPALAQHYEKAADYKQAFEYYRLAGEKAQNTTSIEGAVQLFDRGETALDMLHEDRPQLRNKIKAFGLMTSIYLGLISIMFLMRWMRAGRQSVPFHPLRFLALSAPGAVIFVSIMIRFVFEAKQWSFSVYPDRIRIRSKRRSFEIPFASIGGVQVISYRHRPTPAVLWKKLQLNFDPRYPKYGAGQALGVIRGTRHYIRLDCVPRQGLRRGYYLDLEDPKPFIDTLNRALERYRLMAKSAPAADASASAAGA